MRNALRLNAVFCSSLGALAAYVLLYSYFASGGLPLEESWTNLVYGRSIATEAAVNFNASNPSSGLEAWPWAFALAMVHLVGENFGEVLYLSKCLGLALHVGGVVVWHFALEDHVQPAHGALNSLLLGLHPGLLAAAAAATHVPLAVLALGLLALSLSRRSRLGCALSAAFATTIQLEFAFIALGMVIMSRRSRGALTLGAGLGGFLALVAIGLRNWFMTGHVIPSYLAYEASLPVAFLVQIRLAFVAAPDEIMWMGSSIVIIGLTAYVIYTSARPDEFPDARMPEHLEAVFLSGIVYLGLCIPRQGHAAPRSLESDILLMPAVPLLLAGLSWAMFKIVDSISQDTKIRISAIGGIAIFVSVALYVHGSHRVDMVERETLVHDQTRVQQALAIADSPAGTVWAIHVGALRYLGGHQIIDLSGEHESKIMSVSVASVLEGNRPRYFQLAPPELSLKEYTGKPNIQEWNARVETEPGKPPPAPIGLGYCEPGERLELYFARMGMDYTVGCATK